MKGTDRYSVGKDHTSQEAHMVIISQVSMIVKENLPSHFETAEIVVTVDV